MKPTFALLLAALWRPAGSAEAQAPPTKKPANTTPKTVAKAPAKLTASTPLASLFNAYWEDRAKLFPLNATAQGDNRYNDQLPNDQTRTFRERQRQFYQQYLAGLLKFDRARLSAED